MEHRQLIEALSAPSAYPLAVETVEVIQTHISVVFLAGPLAYKIKKPVDLGFVDYSTLERRRHFCEEEVRLNRRLAPEIYLGVVPVTRQGGTIRMEGTGEVVEWAVKMRRLPDAATLRAHLDRGDVGVEAFEELACRLARFHAAAESGDQVRAGARFEAIARNAARELRAGIPPGGCHAQPIDARSAEAADRGGPGPSPRHHRGSGPARHRSRHPRRPSARSCLLVPGPRSSRRLGRGRLHRVRRPVPPRRSRGRHRFPRHGTDAPRPRRSGRHRFSEAYLRASGDEEGRSLLSFYKAYRAAVRGKVEGMKLAQSEIPEVAAIRGPDPRPCPLALRPGRARGCVQQALPGARSPACRGRGSRPWLATWPSGLDSP